jgi:hypothetical protein
MRVAGKQMIAHSIAKFSGDTAYHTDVKRTYEPPMRGGTDGTAMQDGHAARRDDRHGRQ